MKALLLRILLSVALAVLPLQAWAASGATTVSVFDSGGTARTVNVYSSTGANTGNLSWMNTICDFTTLTQCATVNSSNQLSTIDANSAAILAGIQAAVPALNATNCYTNSYSNAATNPANADLKGNLCVDISPTSYNNKANWAAGTSGNVDNTSQTTIITAPGSGSLYITRTQCFNSGSTTSVVTFNDGATTPELNPAGGGVVTTYDPPLVVAATTAFKFTPGSSSTHQWCNAQGYNAP